MTIESDAAVREAALAEMAADAKLSAVLTLWNGLAAGGALPKPRELDATVLPPFVLPYITILEPVDHGRIFNIRLVGTASVAVAGRDFTGRRLDEAMSEPVLSLTEERYRTAIAQRRPVLACADYVMSDGSTIRNLIMAFPMSTDGIAVDRILGVFSPKSDLLARQTLRTLDHVVTRKPTRSLYVV